MLNTKSDQLKKNIGKKIKFYRKKLGLSQNELAELVKIETKSLSRIESGHNYPQCENLIAIASALNISPWQLYYRDEEKEISLMKEELIDIIKNNKKMVTILYQYYKIIS